MLNRLSELMQTVDRESACLGIVEARALREEIAGHLDAAISARLELGASLEEAEREAVAAFGDVRNIVRSMRVPGPETWFDRRFCLRIGVAWLVVVGTGYFSQDAVQAMPVLRDFVTPVLALSVLALLVVLTIESVKARRVQVLPIAALFAIFTLVGALGQAKKVIPQNSHGHAVERSLAQSQVIEWRAGANRYDVLLRQFADAEARFLRGESVAPIRAVAGEPELWLATVESRTEGQKRWDKAKREWKPQAEATLEAFRSAVAQLEDRLARPWIFDTFGWFGISAGIVVFPSLLTLIVNLFIAFLTWTSQTIRRRRRTA